MSYAKLFSSITESSLWSEPPEVRILFVSMLAKADATGFVEAALPGLARISNLPLTVVETCLYVLESPDPHSKNPAHNGCRVVKVPGGWTLLNYEEYRNRRSEEERREWMRNYMRQRRKDLRACKHDVNSVNPGKPPLAQAEAEAEAVHTRTGHRYAVPAVKPEASVCFEACASSDPKDLARELAAQKRPDNGFSVFDLKSHLAMLYGRNPQAPWAYEEERLAVEVSKRPECQKELAEITQFRSGLAEKRFFPNKLLRLLEDWTGTLDRARNGKSSIGPKLEEVIILSKQKCPMDDRAEMWACSFHGAWQRKGWLRAGVPIDWKIELSKQVSAWGKQA